MTFTVYAHAAEDVKKRLDRLAAKAARYSAPFSYTVSEEHAEVVRVYDVDHVNGVQYETERHTVAAVDFDVECEEFIKANGWTVRARVEHGDKGNIVTALGDKPAELAWFKAPAHCDHCKTNRFRKSDEPGCTRDEVKERVLNGAKPSAEALENAEKVNAWLVGLDQVTGDRWIGDLERNGSMLALSGYAKAKHFGRLAYMPLAYERYLEHKARDERLAAARQAEAGSEHVGTVGQRITVTAATAKLLTSWEGAYGTTYLYKFTDEQGNVYIWYASRGIETHDGMTLKGTVKDHNERDGVKQTVLTRCKAA